MSPHATVFPDAATEADSSSSDRNWFEFQSRQQKITHPQIDQLIEQIADHRVRETMAAVFSSLLHLLNDVPLLDNFEQDESTALQDRFRSDASSLIDFIRAVVTATEESDPSLSETLDGVAFALGHDLRRSFDSEFRGYEWKAGSESARAKIAYVRGLLTNCLQQSVITLAQVFDSSLDGGKLFDNYQARLRESLLLCRDLADLVQVIRACETGVELHFPRLVERINWFRGESLQYLMYKDWNEFESLAENLLQSGPESTEVGSPIHSFHCYLETLLGQVKLRAVLVDVFCDFFPNGEATDPEWGEAQNRLAFELYRVELSSMLDRTLA